MSIRALLFDFDGLILDTESPAFRSWQETYRAHGAALTLERWSAAIGTLEGFDAFADLERAVGRPLDRGAVRDVRRARKDELVEQEDASPGVREWLAEASRRGVAVAIVSSDTRGWVMGHLRRLGLLDGWHSFHCADGNAAIAKPRPDLYVTAMRAIGVGSDEAVAFEDSPNGIAAAKAAGLFCVAIPNPVTVTLDLSAADLVVPSLEAIRPADLLDQPPDEEPEWMDVVDDEDRVVGVARRDTVARERLRHRGVAILIRDGSGSVYVHRRSMTKPFAPGAYDFVVGGAVAAGETYDDAARRELQEEVGITDTELRPLFVHDHKDVAPSRMVVYEARWDGPIRLDPREISWGAFLTPAEVGRRLHEWSFVAGEDLWRQLEVAASLLS